MSSFVTVGNPADIKAGELAQFEVEGTQIAIANVGGSFHGFNDLCTHMQCSLADGELEDVTVTCPCHGSQFDVTTGAVLHPPATEPVATYPVRVEGDALQVEI